MTIGYQRSHRDGVLTLTIDVPEKANAISEDLATRLSNEIRTAGTDPSVRLIVLTGSGSVFCSGADLTERSQGERGASKGNIELYQVVVDSSTPVLARINGHVRAGGMALVAAADLAVASERATFAIPEARLGLIPAVISVTLQRCMPLRWLQYYSLTGQTFGAGEAVACGLIHNSVEHEHLDEEVERIAGQLRKASPAALAGTKSLLTDIDSRADGDAFRRRAELSTQWYRTPDALEGMRAFLEKREPAWTLSSAPASGPR